MSVFNSEGLDILWLNQPESSEEQISLHKIISHHHYTCLYQMLYIYKTCEMFIFRQKSEDYFRMDYMSVIKICIKV